MSVLLKFTVSLFQFSILSLSDVTLACGDDKQVKAHKLFLIDVFKVETVCTYFLGPYNNTDICHSKSIVQFRNIAVMVYRS